MFGNPLLAFIHNAVKVWDTLGHDGKRQLHFLLEWDQPKLGSVRCMFHTTKSCDEV